MKDGVRKISSMRWEEGKNIVKQSRYGECERCFTKCGIQRTEQRVAQHRVGVGKWPGAPQVCTGCGAWPLEHGLWETSIMMRCMVDRKQCRDNGHSILMADNGERSMEHKYREQNICVENGMYRTDRL